VSSRCSVLAYLAFFSQTLHAFPFVQFTDAIRVYLEVGEDGNVDTYEWVKRKRSATDSVVETLTTTNDCVRQRKEELDQAKSRDGTIAGVFAIPEKKSSERDKPVEKTKIEKKKTPTKKKDSKRGREALEHGPKSRDSKEFLGRRVAKFFGKEIFFGTIDFISRFDKEKVWWHVLYDDNDQEDMDYRQLKVAILLYEQHEGKDPKPNPHAPPAKKARK
jgi:hypothetical protein